MPHVNMASQPTIWSKEDSKAIIGEFPPGKYYIGDLSMIMNKETYKSIWGDLFNYSDGVYTSCNGNFAIFGTIGICSEGLCVDDVKNASYHEFRKPVKFVFSNRGYTFISGDWSLYIGS